jgi:DNA-binding CsgD family transcriptional regulator
VKTTSMKMTSDTVAAGMAALSCGDWAQARAHFEAALGTEETAQALDGLSEALYWLDEIERSLEHRTRAYALYREQGDVCRAVRAALWIVWGHSASLGNQAVANGWLQRAERLLQEVGDCPEQGWLKQFRSKTAPDAATSIRHAQEAIDIARHHGDRDLEVWALSQQGRALVIVGRVDEGMAMLDEAVAAATAGEARNLLVVGDTCCNMLSACDRALDFDRARQWCHVVDEFTRRHHGVPLFHYCRVVYSGVLIATGRWAEAESELRRGLQAVEKQHPAQKVYSLSRLALLCVRQGRLEVATQLLVGLETQGAAAEALVSLHLAQGRATLANALLENRLAVPVDDLVAVPSLRLSVDTKLLLGDLPAAQTSAMRLVEIGERSGRPAIQAQALLSLGRVEFACGKPALIHFENACALFERLNMPFDTAITRMEWARALAAVAGTLDVASEYVRRALSVFEQLGARLYSDQAAALLRELGVGSRPGPRVSGKLTRREGEVLDLLSHGLSNPEMGRRLFISPKTVEHHVSRILSKLGLRTRAEAMAWALRNPSQKSDTK